MTSIRAFLGALHRFLCMSWEAVMQREADCLRRAEVAHKDATEALLKVMRGERHRGVSGEVGQPMVFKRDRWRVGGPVGAD
jgi:hypothetical protein